MIPLYERTSSHFRVFTTSNLTFPPHLHTQLELILIENGEIELSVDSTHRLLKGGDFVIVFPNHIHSYQSTESVDNHAFVTIFPIELSGDFLSILLKQYPTNPFIDINILHPDIIFSLRSLAQLQNPAEDIELIKAYLHLILARLLPSLTLKPNHDRQPLDYASRLISYLSEYYLDPISLESAALHLGISKYSISRIFSEKLQISFCSYINALRINNAQTLLQGTDQSILAISLSCGYDNSRTFNREFKKICGCTPREYRNHINSVF